MFDHGRLRAALDHGFEVTGVELEPKCADALRARFGDRANVITAPIESTSFPENFDVVVMRDVLEHIPNPVALLQSIGRIMNPEGSLVIQVPNADGLIYRLVGARHTVVFGFAHPNYWTPSSLEMALNRAGFKVRTIEHQSLDFTIQVLLSYWLGPSTFTTVVPRRRSSFVQRLDTAAQRLCWEIGPRLDAYAQRLGWQIGPQDRRLAARVADRLRRGSVLRVIAQLQ